MKTVLTVVVLLLVLIGIGAVVYRDQLAFMLAFSSMEPGHGFAEDETPAPPDYANPAHWAALPLRNDDADVVPAHDMTDNQATARADAFFVHPTTYFNAEHWNQPLDNVAANRITDQSVLRGQASAFNSCCKVYAPHYRQATLYAFFDDTGNGDAALELAYGDVVQAFDHFLEHYNQGRPFILAGHSQGSAHLGRLLEERITGTPLAARLIGAYTVGFGFDADAYSEAVPDVPVCARPEQTQCLVTWNAVGPDMTRLGDTSGQICVNPLTWRTDGDHAPPALNLGAVIYPTRFEGGSLAELTTVPENFVADEAVVEPGAADARCVDGQLLVTEIRSDAYQSQPMGRDNYHPYDYNLFYTNIRRNADARVAAFLRD